MFPGRMDNVNASGAAEPEDGELEDLRITVKARGEAVVLAVAGELDMLTAPRLQEEIAAQLDSRPPVLAVDLSQVEFLASAGMNVLMMMNEAAHPRTQLRVVATGSRTLRPLQVAGLTEYLVVFESLDAALTD